MPKIISGEPHTARTVTQQQNVSSSRASVWGRHVSIISLAVGEQVDSPIREGPSTAGPGPGSEAPSGVKMSCEWATEQSDNMLEESWCGVLLDITRAFESMLPITPILLVRWCLLKMCTSSHSSHTQWG